MHVWLRPEGPPTRVVRLSEELVLRFARESALGAVQAAYLEQQIVDMQERIGDMQDEITFLRDIVLFYHDPPEQPKAAAPEPDPAPQNALSPEQNKVWQKIKARSKSK